MSTTQKQASIARSIFFRAKGLAYSAFLHASTGDLIQQYDDDGKYYPEITPTNPIRLQFTATSSRQVGAITPDSITYKVAGVTLGFDASGNCNSPANASGYFKKDGADLLVIGNIADYLNKTSSVVEAIAKKGSDDLYACCPADISQYQGGRKKKVSIAAADNKNFTLTSQTDSVKLRAGVLGTTGWSYNNARYKYYWEISDPTQTSGWRELMLDVGALGGTVTIPAAAVDTYANIRCTVYNKDVPDLVVRSGNAPSGLMIGTDCVGVMDASDPLDIICTVKLNKTGTGTEVDAEIEELDDTMPDAAYLIYTPVLVMRGQNTSAGTTTWLNGFLTDPAGVQTRVVAPSSGKYKVMVSDIKASYGEHTLVMSGKLA